MSDDGPVMLVATNVLRKRETRIGKISENITLPRTVRLSTALAAAGGGLLGIVAGLFIGGVTVQSMVYGALFGGVVGVFLVTYSPLQGESMLTWMGLAIRSKTQQIYVNGEAVQVAVGVRTVTDTAHGSVQLMAGAVNVPPDRYDERGVLLPDNGSGAGPGRHAAGAHRPAAPARPAPSMAPLRPISPNPAPPARHVRN